MANNDTIYQGNLTIRTAQDAKKYSNVTKVTGDLSINASAKLDALKSVGGDLSIKNRQAANVAKPEGYPTAHRVPHLAVSAARSPEASMSSDKPLFIPLKAEYYDAFVRREKSEELRKWGPRWNNKVCAVGRQVVLSRGYGKTNRMRGIIRMVRTGSLAILTEKQRQSMLNLYNHPGMIVIAIGIDLVGAA